MALPTAQTPGYTTYAGKVSCVCLAEWLPWLERLCLAHGYIRYRLDVLQLTGTYALSGGTHAGGGVYDIKQYDARIVALAREMGAPATWMRNMLYADGSPGNTHTHGVLSGCPHNSQARYQITAQRDGYDGMGYMGRKGPDPHPDPKVYRTWSQGIEWAKAEIVRITGEAILGGVTTEEDDVLSAEAQAWIEERMDAHDAYVLANLKATLGEVIARAVHNQRIGGSEVTIGQAIEKAYKGVDVILTDLANDGQ